MLLENLNDAMQDYFEEEGMPSAKASPAVETLCRDLQLNNNMVIIIMTIALIVPVTMTIPLRMPCNDDGKR